MDSSLADDLSQLLVSEKYIPSLKEAITNRYDSIIVDFRDLSDKSKETLLNKYYEQLQGKDNINVLGASIFNKYARENKLKGNFGEVLLRFSNVSNVKKIRKITSDDIGKLMLINGIVTSVYNPKSIIKVGVFECPVCHEYHKIDQVGNKLVYPTECSCDNKKKFILINAKSEYRDYQEMIIQENPEDVETSRVPRSIKLSVIGNSLIDSCKPSDVVNVICTLIPSYSMQPTTFDWVLQINNIEVLNLESFSTRITEEDEYLVQNWSKHPRIREIIVKSIFTSIYGYREEKYGLVCGIFGGTEQKKRDMTRRGTINVALLGDPSTAKSRMLEAAKNNSPKAVYTSGGGASGAGLTAAAINERGVGWRLEAGALVLADRGICCIDELEKMKEEERQRVHDAMSIQKVFVDRADIHVTLNARTAVLAAANPVFGRYDPYKTMAANVSLPSTILSRFDLIFIMKDKPNEEWDRNLMEVMLDKKAAYDDNIPVMEPEILKKYILYAQRLQPKLNNEAIEIIVDFYVKMRKMSENQIDNPIAITARQGEGIRRISEAIARMALKPIVEKEDAEMAIELMMTCLKGAGYDPETDRIDIGIWESGVTVSADRKAALIESILRNERSPMHLDDICEVVKDKISREEVGRLIIKYLGHCTYHPTGDNNVWQII